MGAVRDDKTGLSRASMESIGTLMAALADPNRIALLDVLRRGEANVQTLADRLDIPRRNVSHHLSILRGAGLLASRREGISVIYSIEDWGAWWLIEKAAEADVPPGPHRRSA